MRNYYWIFYPVIVVFVVGLSLWAVFGSGRVQWEDILASQKKVDVQQSQVQQLKAKIEKMRLLSQPKLEEDLRLLVSGIPTNRQVLPLVSELKMAAALSGTEVEGYTAKVGEVLEASGSGQLEDLKWNMEVGLVVGDIAQLRDYLSKLEGMVPLVEVVSVDYTVGRAKIIVAQRFSPIVKLPSDPYQPLPDTELKLSNVRTSLSQYSTSGLEF